MCDRADACAPVKARVKEWAVASQSFRPSMETRLSIVADTLAQVHPDWSLYRTQSYLRHVRRQLDERLLAQG